MFFKSMGLMLQGRPIRHNKVFVLCLNGVDNEHVPRLNVKMQ